MVIFNKLHVPPREKKIYHYIANFLNFFGTGDRRSWGYKQAGIFVRVHAYIMPPAVTMVLFSQVLYLVTHFKHIEFAIVGSIFSILSVNLLVEVAIFSARFKSYKWLMDNLMDNIHLYNFVKGDTIIADIYMKVEKNIKYTAFFLLGVLTVDWISWIFVPIYKNHINKENIVNKTMHYQTCIYVWAPFDYQFNFKNWLIVHLFNVYGIWVGCLTIVCFSTSCYIFIFLFIGHIKVLRHKIQTYFLGKLSDSEVHERLVDVIKYHSFIIALFKKIQLAFGAQVAATYLHNLVGDSLMLYLVMNGDKGNFLIFGFMIVVYMGSMILISFVLEEIRQQSDTLSNAVYAVPWETMSVANQKTLLMFLRRVQPPFVFAAAGGLDTGVRPMLSIMKSIFSYYVMLSSSV